MRSARQEEEQRATHACSASRSAALDLAGVPAKIEHRGQKKSVYGYVVSGGNREGERARAEYRAARDGLSYGDLMCGLSGVGGSGSENLRLRVADLASRPTFRSSR